MPFLTDIACFVELGKALHYGRAAAALDMPASTLSRRISTLEAELGVTLVNRSTRRVALTEAGQACFQSASKLVEEANNLRDNITQNASAMLGRIRIGATWELSRILFIPIFAQFARCNPGVSLELISIHGNPPNLVNDGLDLAFIVAHQGALPNSSQVARSVGTLSRYLVASKTYLQRNGTPQEPTDLQKHSCIQLSRGTVQKEWELRRGKERRNINVTGQCSATNAGLIAQFAREHFGVAIVPRLLATDSVFGEGLVRVLPDWEAVPARILAFTATHTTTGKVSKLIESIKAGVSKRLKDLEHQAASTT